MSSPFLGNAGIAEKPPTSGTCKNCIVALCLDPLDNIAKRKFEDKLIVWAAKYVREHATPDWQANVIFKEKLAKRLTSLIAKEKAPTRDNITKNWVTRNGARIHVKTAKSTKQSL